MGELQHTTNRISEVAVKKVQAEYKDKWNIEHIKTQDDKLKAHFYKSREEIQATNQGIESFLQEALIMRQFDHPNILCLIGVSIQNSNPCVLLPLMAQRDLKNYLKKHDRVSVCISFQIHNLHQTSSHADTKKAEI